MKISKGGRISFTVYELVGLISGKYPDVFPEAIPANIEFEMEITQARSATINPFPKKLHVSWEIEVKDESK